MNFLKSIAIGLFLVFLVSCQPSREKQMKELTKESMLNSLPTVMGYVSKSAAEKGYAPTIKTCSTQLRFIKENQGQGLATIVKEKYGLKSFKVKRTSLKLRNPTNKPSAAEAKVLSQWQQKEAQGQKATITVTKDQNKWFGLAPIRVQSPLCLGCHGAEENLAKGVKTELAKSYPHDQATGYKMGDLRGAFVVEAEFQ